MRNFETPILFIVFNRPDTTKEVLKSLKELKPKYLYIASDGPRLNVQQDQIKCAEVRQLIDEEIDWDCEVKKFYQSSNLGCGKAVSSAITWFFDCVEAGIILEDDCVPNVSFFNFCREMLEYHRLDEKIFTITGQNLQHGNKRGDGSYYYSKYFYVWGWASWKRAWEKYSFKMDGWESFKEQKLKKLFDTNLQLDFWSAILEKCYQGKIDTWDYQFQYTIFKNDGITIVPNENLISNIGFGVDATHTASEDNALSKMKTKEMHSISHPTSLVVNKKADDYFFYKIVKNYKKYNGTKLSLYMTNVTENVNSLKSLSKKVIKKIIKVVSVSN